MEQWYSNFGAVSFPNYGGVLVFSEPVSDDNSYTRVNIFQVQGNQIVTGQGFQFRGTVQYWVSSKACADYSSPDTVYIANGGFYQVYQIQLQ